uniref:NADP-dependent oxidoreductase domain-containing protein n=2 Tax=Alexandrium monilatum TaxID=311494 RepID=A0A7S4V201_9DINO|mmetsp:Transcript_94765/g.292155  ORF Transcript_94765/g.292155 Transcript_94765/m.292155 type:complete len:224 (+) Transcript_94765:165-836(+)
MGFDEAIAACEASLQRLGRKVLDVYLIHWPAIAKRKHASGEHRTARHRTWRALEALQRQGRVRTIGVSNFTAQHLEQLLEDGVDVVPSVNQLEAHPLYLPRDTVDFCERQGIAVQAYSPLGGGPGSNAARAAGGTADGTRLLLGHPAVRAAALELGRTPAQVVLRWGLQRGFAVVPRSSNRERIAENASVFDFSLPPTDMAALDALRAESCAQKFCWDPSTVH